MTSPSQTVSVTWQEVFKESTSEDPYLEDMQWREPIQFFVGPNGSGKSKAAEAIAKKLGQDVRRLSTDRLSGFQRFTSYKTYSILEPEQSLGVPLGKEEGQVKRVARDRGVVTDALYILRENPHIFIKLSALLSRAFGRSLQLTEQAGFLDPTVLGPDGGAYSLLRDEGHGLRELVALLTFTYEDAPDVLIVDEPELHLHPSVTRFWIEELREEFQETGRRAIIVTHEPSLLRPTTPEELDGIWVFRPGRPPTRLGGNLQEESQSAALGGLVENPSLVADLVFSPRPVLVEGIHDRAALQQALQVLPREVFFQTDPIPCGGSAGVSAWFEIASNCGLDVRAVADLDALLSPSVARAMDRNDEVERRYAEEMYASPARTSEVLRDFYPRMKADGVSASPKDRAVWLAALSEQADKGPWHRLQQILDIWRDAGLWLHPQGRIEDVLGISEKASVVTAIDAAKGNSALAKIASYVAYSVDLRRDIFESLGYECRRTAQAIQLELSRDAHRQFNAPSSGPASFADSLVSITPLGSGVHQLSVKTPPSFAGYSFSFDARTPLDEMELRPPGNSAPSAVAPDSSGT